MVTYKVVDPSDRLNPLDAQLLTRSLIYHGARSLFCKSIEEHGLSSQRFRSTYGPAIERVVAHVRRLHFMPEGYAAAQAHKANEETTSIVKVELPVSNWPIMRIRQEW